MAGRVETTTVAPAAAERRRAAGSGALGAGVGALHPGAWLAWLAGGCVAVLLTSNLLYLSLALLASLGVYLSVRDTRKGRALGAFVVVGLALAALSIPLNTLTGSNGPSEFLTLPQVGLPRWFGGVTFGGPITGEALVTATGRALGIATLVVLAGAFNSAIDHHRLVRLAPRSLSQVALALTIAIAVIPQGIAHARSVAEAKRLRGRPARGLRSIPGLLLPTLQGALERSIQRAESLDARGFGGGLERGGTLTALAGVAGLGLGAWGAFAHFYYGSGLLPSLAMAGGLGLTAAVLLRGGGGSTTERLYVDVWTARDSAVAFAAALAVGMLFALRTAGMGDVAYLAFPEVALPAFHPAGAVAFVLLLVPAIASPAPEADP